MKNSYMKLIFERYIKDCFFCYMLKLLICAKSETISIVVFNW